ncbi:MAG: glycosyltransferase family 4 protein [Acidobacteriota bacterium]|nr:glycosyltransferase family 4 protein [Acidobacteriota bacterium]
MRIALIGGIYGKDARYRASVLHTPETTLEAGLKKRGHSVKAFSHHADLSGQSFDVIHVHHLGYGALRAAVDTSRAAFVYTSHDGSALAGVRVPYRRHLASRFVMARADAVVALSQAEAEFESRRYQLSGAMHAVIPNGIDTTVYSCARRRSGGSRRSWRLLFVGQLIASKNVDVLLRAIARLRAPVELDLAYQNPALEIPLRNLAASLGLLDKVRFLGAKSPFELAGLYQHADVFVLPSAAESLPCVIAEAMLCGTPVVATDVGGIREQLAGYGSLVSPGNSAELAAAIGSVLDHYEWFSSLGESMSQSARRRFSIDAMADRHLKLYAELLGRQGPRRRHGASAPSLGTALTRGVRLLCATK